MRNYFLGIIFSLLPSVSVAQVSLKREAEFHSISGNYSSAVKLFERYLYFYPDSGSSLLYTSVADCHLLAGNYSRANFYYDLASYSEPDESHIIDLRLKKASAFLLTHEYNQSLAELLPIDKVYNDNQRLLKNFYFGSCYYALNNYSEATMFFNACVNSKQDSIRLNNILKDWYKSEKRKPNVAKLLSVFLPGLGQTYAGDVKSGLNSLLLSASLGVLFFYVSGTYGLIDGIFAVMPWFQRYYKGGYMKAPKILEKSKQEKRDRYYKEILLVINNPSR